LADDPRLDKLLSNCKSLGSYKGEIQLFNQLMVS
jgi:hypothetical protein